jgi:hypothetical protein
MADVDGSGGAECSGGLEGIKIASSVNGLRSVGSGGTIVASAKIPGNEDRLLLASVSTFPRIFTTEAFNT